MVNLKECLQIEIKTLKMKYNTIYKFTCESLKTLFVCGHSNNESKVEVLNLYSRNEPPNLNSAFYSF